MRVIETTVYQFDELSDDAKDKAREWFSHHISDGFSSHDASVVLEDAATVAGLLGISISTRTARLGGGGTRQEPIINWEVGSYRGTDGACFAGSYSYRKGSVKAVKEYAPKDEKLAEIASTLQACQRAYFYRLNANIENGGRSNDSSSMRIDVGYDGREYREVDERTIGAIEDAIKGFADWIGDRLTAEWEYQHSNEAIDDNIRANEYEFTVDGSID